MNIKWHPAFLAWHTSHFLELIIGGVGWGGVMRRRCAWPLSQVFKVLRGELFDAGEVEQKEERFADFWS